MKYKWKPLVLALAIPLAVGGLSALLTRQGMAVFRALEKPPLAPPGWLFPAVWTILFLLMGLASYLVFAAGRGTQSGRTALWFYAVQLLFNFFWPIFSSTAARTCSPFSGCWPCGCSFLSQRCCFSGSRARQAGCWRRTLCGSSSLGI